MEIGSISSALMTSVTVARNASRENSPWQQRVKVVVGTPCFLLVASVAVVETVVYAIFAQMALPFCPLTKKPFLFFGERLKSSSFTALWALAVACIFNRRSIRLPVDERTAPFYAQGINRTTIPVANPRLLIQFILHGMPEFEEDDYSDPAFMSRLFEAIIFRCLFAQGESRFLLKFLQKGTQDKLTELQDKTYPPNVIEALRKKIFTKEEVSTEEDQQLKELWKEVVGIASKESQGSPLNQWLGEVLHMNPRSSEISFMKEILPNLAHVFFTSLQFFQLQSAAGKGAFYDKASGYMEAGYPYVRILLSFVILKSIPQHEVGRRIPFFLADILLLGDAFAKVAGQFTIRKLSPLPPAPIGMAFRVAHVRALFFNLNIFMGADNLFSKTASIFSVFASGGCILYGDVPSRFICVARAIAGIARLYELVLKKSP